MRDALIIEGVRTPLGRRNGSLSNIRSDDLMAVVLKELIHRTGISSSFIDDVIIGCVSQVNEQGGNIARLASLIAGFPIEVPGTTIDRQCGSSQQAVHFASQAILSGDMDVVIAGGIENMSRVPMFSNRLDATFSEKLTSKYEMIHQGLSAERIADIWELDRKHLDEFSLKSHQKAIVAQDEGRFNREIIPVDIILSDGTSKTIKYDEGPRESTSLEALSGLKPSFKTQGKIHAGNSSQISDGAAALLIMSSEMTEQFGLKPRFRILTRTVVGSDPTLTLTGPIDATHKALKNSGLSIDNIDVFEVNEAFSPVPLIWLKETGADPRKLNPNGGAIALGHPLGASGTRLMVTMMNELERTGGRYGLQAICEAHGTANATIIERIS